MVNKIKQMFKKRNISAIKNKQIWMDAEQHENRKDHFDPDLG